MTAATDQFADIAKRGQTLVTESVRSWTDTVQGFAQQISGGTRPQLPDAGAAVDRVFDFYEQLLGQQREFAKTVVGASTSVFDQVAESATRAAETVGEQVSAAGTAENAGAAEKTASSRSTRSTTK
ncbi:hypothetical protein [Pseudonocardia phyllosphaerae]|uniref:hypothetical protein n=1 Tax=Pseudonocardia phyllosphaerae TaxID=3390502 RepID=UPI0039788134